MELTDKLKKCSVKIATLVSGGKDFATGVIYITSNNCIYDYILTAKHTFLEEGMNSFETKKISYIDILYYEDGAFSKLEHINQKEIHKRVILFGEKEDFVIIKIMKIKGKNIPQILIADLPHKKEEEFLSWSVAYFNDATLNYLEFKRNDPGEKKFRLEGQIKSSDNYQGISGSGMFSRKKAILYGIIRKYPNKLFENNVIQCHPSSFNRINEDLKIKKEETLQTISSKSRRVIGDDIIDIKQAVINNVCLNLDCAMKRVKSDLRDDWYIDPLHYVDLMNWDYIFKQLKPYFHGKKYCANAMELFFIPKKQFTLRQALVGTYIDRLIYTAIVGVLAERLNAALIPNVYSARYNDCQDEQLIINGVEQWKKMKYQFARCAEQYNCVIKIDLLNYYDNINKKILYEKIVNVCETDNEKAAADMLYETLKQFSSKEIGLPQNNDASSLLASFYLNQVDTFMLHHAPEYYRFMDDIHIFCNDKYEARGLFQILEMELRRCQLSINSQKSEIKEIKKKNDKKEFIQSLNLFDLELNKIDRLKRSDNYVYLNEAFHLNMRLLKNSIQEDYNSSKEKTQKLKYSLEIFHKLGKKKVKILNTDFSDYIIQLVTNLHDNPWFTPQICNILYACSKDQIDPVIWDKLVTIVLSEKYNIYTWQTYQIWLLLAFHQIRTKELSSFAVRSIESNDETKRPVIAAMLVYMGCIDPNYRRIVLRKYREGFVHGYFQNRFALIVLRSFPTDLIPVKQIHPTLSEAHPFLYKYKDKDLVYIPDIQECELSDDIVEQLYSI